MSFFVPSGTGLLWNSTNSWLSSSTATAPSGWATASTVPGAADDVFMFGRSMTLDVTNINVQSIRNTPSGSISTAGGTLTFSSANTIYRVTASNGLYVSGSTLLANGTTSQTIYITASQFNGTLIAAAHYLIQPSSNTTIDIIGEMTGTNNSGGPLIYVTNAGCQIRVQGNVTGSVGSSIYMTAASTTITITGSVGSRGGLNAITYTNTVTGGSLNILGNVDPPTSTAQSIGNAATGQTNTYGLPGVSVRIEGNVTAGPLAEAIRSTAVNPNITITGNVAASNTFPAIAYAGSGSITVTGTVTAGTNVPGIISTNANGLVTVNGKIVNTNGYLGVLSQRLILTGSDTQPAQWVYQDPTNTNVTFGIVTATASPPAKEFVRRNVYTMQPGGELGTFDVPAISDVRLDTSYDTGSLGTMRVPSYLDVRAGIAVDSGSGTIIMPVESQVQSGVTFDSGSSKTGTYDGVNAFWGYSTASMSAGSIGALITQSLDVRIGTITGSIIAELDNTNTTSNTVRRMQNAATVQTTGDQLSSYDT